MAAPGDRDRQQKETDYLRLKQGIVKKWEALNGEQQSLLWEAEQHFTASTLPELASVQQILVCLEKVGILSPNSVNLISLMCELVDCVDGAQLVQAYLNKHPPREVGLGQRREHTGSNTAGLSYDLAAETEESRRRSMALWGHAAPRPAPVAAVCECHHASHRPPSKPSHHSRHPAISVEQALDPTLSGGGGGSRRGMGGVTPAGARRARLVDFLSTRLGARYHELGEQMECVSGSDLANITADTSCDLVRRLRRIRFNRLADELELWSEAEDRLEDPRDWSEDKRRWRNAQRH